MQKFVQSGTPNVMLVYRRNNACSVSTRRVSTAEELMIGCSVSTRRVSTAEELLLSGRGGGGGGGSGSAAGSTIWFTVGKHWIV